MGVFLYENKPILNWIELVSARCKFVFPFPNWIINLPLVLNLLIKVIDFQGLSKYNNRFPWKELCTHNNWNSLFELIEWVIRIPRGRGLGNRLVCQTITKTLGDSLTFQVLRLSVTTDEDKLTLLADKGRKKTALEGWGIGVVCWVVCQAVCRWRGE